MKQDFHSIALFLYCEAFPTSAGTGCIRVDKVKSFPIQPVAKVQLGAKQVKKAFHVHGDLNAFIFKILIAFLGLVVKVELVRQARASASGNAYTQEVIASELRIAY